MTESKDKRLFAPIHCASQTGNVECLEVLLEGGTEVNCRGFAGATPLHITVSVIVGFLSITHLHLKVCMLDGYLYWHLNTLVMKLILLMHGLVVSQIHHFIIMEV